MTAIFSPSERSPSRTATAFMYNGRAVTRDLSGCAHRDNSRPSAPRSTSSQAAAQRALVCNKIACRVYFTEPLSQAL